MDSPGERDQAIERLLRQSLRTPPRGGVTDACPDAETLAAWAEGGLSGAGLEAVQRHVADCARCQELAGTLARIPTTVARPEAVHASRRWLAWLVPLTAAAAAVALWFAVPGNLGKPVSSREIARVSPAPPQTQVERQSQTVQADKPAPRAPREPAAPPAARLEPPTAPETQAPQVAGAQQPSVAETAVKEAAGNQIARDQVEAEAAAPAVAAPRPAAPPPAQRAGAARSALRAADAVGPEIVSPDPAVRWRILGTSVQHSSDAGATWENVSIGFPVELTAGAAPSTTVCWLVGRNGAVLLTIDGRTWRRVPFPETTDLSAVRAVDAGGRVASVSTTDGRMFVTTDAGASWTTR